MACKVQLCNAGIDVGKEKHRAVVKDENYKIAESFWFKTDYRGFDELST